LSLPRGTPSLVIRTDCKRSACGFGVAGGYGGGDDLAYAVGR
jgi:hypothetical protein